MQGTSGNAPRVVDYDLHEIVGIRVVGGSRSDQAAVARQLGPIESHLEREPDIVVRFVPHLETPKGLRYLGVGDAAYCDDGFYVLRGRHETQVRVRIPFHEIGKRCEIVCESGLRAVPLLIAIVNLTALNKGFVPLHASAFRYAGTGVLTTGWAKGGKTETLLAFLAQGGEYIGDEWVYVSADGQRMCGMPEPVTLCDWHLREMPSFAAKVGLTSRLRMAAMRRAAGLLRAANGERRARSTAISRILALLERQLFVRVSPERVFGERFGYCVGTPHKVIFVASHDAPDVTVRPLDPREVAERMIYSLRIERSEFLDYYTKFRFAFPRRPNELIEKADEIERDILMRALADKEAYAVYHPYPVSIPVLFDAIRPLLEEPAL